MKTPPPLLILSLSCALLTSGALPSDRSVAAYEKYKNDSHKAIEKQLNIDFKVDTDRLTTLNKPFVVGEEVEIHFLKGGKYRNTEKGIFDGTRVFMGVARVVISGHGQRLEDVAPEHRIQVEFHNNPKKFKEKMDEQWATLRKRRAQQYRLKHAHSDRVAGYTKAFFEKTEIMAGHYWYPEELGKNGINIQILTSENSDVVKITVKSRVKLRPAIVLRINRVPFASSLEPSENLDDMTKLQWSTLRFEVLKKDIGTNAARIQKSLELIMAHSAVGEWTLTPHLAARTSAIRKTKAVCKECLGSTNSISINPQPVPEKAGTEGTEGTPEAAPETLAPIEEEIVCPSCFGQGIVRVDPFRVTTSRFRTKFGKILKADGGSHTDFLAMVKQSAQYQAGIAAAREAGKTAVRIAREKSEEAALVKDIEFKKQQARLKAMRDKTRRVEKIFRWNNTPVGDDVIGDRLGRKEPNDSPNGSKMDPQIMAGYHCAKHHFNEPTRIGKLTVLAYTDWIDTAKFKADRNRRKKYELSGMRYRILFTTDVHLEDEKAGANNDRAENVPRRNRAPVARPGIPSYEMGKSMDGRQKTGHANAREGNGAMPAGNGPRTGARKKKLENITPIYLLEYELSYLSQARSLVSLALNLTVKLKGDDVPNIQWKDIYKKIPAKWIGKLLGYTKLTLHQLGALESMKFVDKVVKE